MSADDLELEVRETFYDSVVEMFEFDLSVLPNVTGTTKFYFTNFVIPKEGIFPSVGGGFQTGEKVKWRRNETSTANQEYEPVPIIASGFDRTTKGQIPQPELQISNVFGLLSELIESLDDLIGVKVTRRRTLAKYLGNFPTKDYDTYFPSDIFYIERKVSETSMAITFQLASPFDLEGLQIPRRVVTHNHCLWEYRGNQCGYGSGRDSDLNGLPVANQFDDVPLSGDLYDSFSSGQKNYLQALSDYNTNRTARDNAEAEMNIALGKKEAACDLATETKETKYSFDSASGEVSSDDLTFAIVDTTSGDEVQVIVWEGSVVTDSKYKASDKVGNTSGGSAKNDIPLDVYEMGGNFSKDAPLSVCIEAKNIDATDYSNERFVCFAGGALLLRHRIDVETNEDKESSSFKDRGLREVDKITTSDPADCSGKTAAYDAAVTAFNAAQDVLDDSYDNLQSNWAALSSSEQDGLRDQFDICGKRLTSCKLRFGEANLPFGGFPGSNLAR